ncbi:MAG: hypothetical protein PHN69_01565 [Candidatus Pacebacteria bacterium]|nr:hypothetical protein [Candidatus Paceibacterota bacterium]
MTIMLREVLKELVYIPDNLLGIICDFLKKLNADKSGEFLKRTKMFLRNESCRVVLDDIFKILKIDRTQPFDLKKFFGDGWTIVEEDINSLKLTEFNLTKVQFKDMLKEGETSVNGEEKQKRLKEAGYVRLDAKVFQTLWENQELIPSSWKEPINGKTRYIFFDGTVLSSPDSGRYVLCLYWLDGGWCRGERWLGNALCDSLLSVVLES